MKVVVKRERKTRRSRGSSWGFVINARGGLGVLPNHDRGGHSRYVPLRHLPEFPGWANPCGTIERRGGASAGTMLASPLGWPLCA